MPTSTNIYLPLSIPIDKISLVIAKLVGVSLSEAVFETADWSSSKGIVVKKKPSFDSALPSSKENPWHMSFQEDRLKNNYGHMTPDKSLRSANFSFEDGAGGMHEWFYLFREESEKYQLFTPNSTPLAVALGVRLVQFFGGLCEKSDSSDKEMLKTNTLRVRPTKALFPPKTPQQSSNDRWYQFNNAVQKLIPISAIEMKQSEKMASYGMSETQEKLMAWMESRTLAKNMNEELDRGAQKPGRRPRL